MRKVWVQFSGCLPIKFLLPFFILVSLAACNFPLGSPAPFFDPTSFAQTAEFQLTQIAANVATMVGANLTQPAVTPTPIVITLTPSPILSFTAAPPESSCDRAGAGAILDVTYPDDSRLLPGQPFTKIWRLVNRGSCPWNRDYQVVWFSGDRLGTSSSQPLPGKVDPGESVDIAVDMLAPQQPGLYTSYWMLRNPEGKLFGIGPGGNAPFWVRIQVVAVYTPTPTSTPTMTPTPMILASGRFELQPGLGVDLDSGEVTDDEGVDLRLIQSEEGSFWFEVDENAGLMIFGEVAPSLNDCRSAIFSSTRISVESLSEGLNLCYRTNEGLPGSMRMVSVSQAPLVMRFDFVTWLIP
ncbi:NBR1-Ig-like domain-containing protein [Bellilinea sp.]|uniref:NBR1-Ig-like domain-containing protein n=1 Tax=Bellilinea sp. TaxID=2838785 RepID=UPI002ADD73C2|nr:NBR1-Ig-like domain-containing protein [Bellilinea sp.]